MSKTSSQKEAKKRRKERAKELRDLGRQATSKLSEAEMKVESVDLTRRCMCGCFLGNHYLTYVPGGHMCSTCESCDGFMAEGQQSGTA